jgi:hypothetical protein
MFATFRSRMIGLLGGCMLAAPAWAQAVLRDEEFLRFDRPEAWAMAYVTGSTLLTGFGELPALAPGNWVLSGELGHIPRLDDEQQRVGFNGVKPEDLNKSPVFGRVRAWVGLPYGVVAELGWTPPVQVDGVEPEDLFALALGRRLHTGERWSLSARLFGQHGAAHGDITCAADLVGAPPAQNPFGCVAPSDDRIDLNYYGAELGVGYGPRGSPWRGHASVGYARAELRVQVDAELQDYRDRSHLIANGDMPYFAAGARRELARGWSLAGEVLYVPLDVERPPGGAASGNDPYWSLRLMLRYALGAGEPAH